MYYKDDWLQSKKRLEAFWNERQMIDRCCMAVFAPRKTSKLPPFPELQWGPWLGGLETMDEGDEKAIKDWWVDPQKNYERMITWFENTYFGGEAIPCTYVNWGASAMAAFYGSPPVFKKSSVWFEPVIDDWEEWEWKFDRKTNPSWQQTLAIVDYLIEKNDGRYFVGTPEFGCAGDLLTLMRGMDQLSIDLYEHPEQVKHAVDVLSDTWVELHELIYQKTKLINEGGVLAWMSLWAPGRHSQIACDFSSVLSPKMFKEFFVPEIHKEAEWCDYATYHLDGPAAIKHQLDTLLSLDYIDMIEWTPGTGSPPTYTAAYLPLYKKMQAAGKRLYLLAQKEEIEPLLAELSSHGLFICTQADSEEEADEILQKAEKWSHA
jgi:hypothetical protein